ncbi:hypothetical protein Tco_0102278 [Tanacetum coccineum]
MNKVKLNDDIINASADVGKKEQSTKQKKGTKMKKLVVRKTLKSVQNKLKKDAKKKDFTDDDDDVIKKKGRK